MRYPQGSTPSGEPKTRIAPELVKNINWNFQSLSLDYSTSLQEE